MPSSTAFFASKPAMLIAVSVISLAMQISPLCLVQQCSEHRLNGWCRLFGVQVCQCTAIRRKTSVDLLLIVFQQCK